MIGWHEMLKGKVLKQIRDIHITQCSIVPCHMNGRDWMKHFVSRLIHISHPQWIFRNYTLYEKACVFFSLEKQKRLATEICRLINVEPEDIPQESRFLPELDFDSLFAVD